MNKLKNSKERLAFAIEMREKFPPKSGVHPSVEIPPWVELGVNVTIHAQCTLGTDGFGFAKDKNGDYLFIPHIGKVIIHDNVEIFPGTNITRGVRGDTIIGAGTKIGPHCHIGHNVVIGKRNLIAVNAVICGYVFTEDNVWIGPHCSISNELRIAESAFIGIHSNVMQDVPKEAVVVGNPARILRIGNPPHLQL